MDSLGNPLVLGKYYQLETHNKAQYTGLDNEKDKNYLFQWNNPVNKKIILLRTRDMINDSPPILINNVDDDDGTDDEYEENPYEEIQDGG
jgi:hypothetical protein